MKNITDIMDIETSIVSLYEASILDDAISEASLLDNAISEASLLDIEDTIEDGDKISEDMFKLQWGYAYLNNLPWNNKSAISGGMRKIYRKYFNKSVPTLFTDRHSTLETLLKKPERKHKLDKLDIDGDYLASYLLQVELDKLVSKYDFISNKSDMQYLENKLQEHLNKILNDEGKENLKVSIHQYYRGDSTRILSVYIVAPRDDFKPYVALTTIPYKGVKLIGFNFTEGQYYYK